MTANQTSKKISIRFFNDREVRAIWDGENNKWWFAAVDVAGILSESSNPTNYWRVLKNRLLNEKSKTITNSNAFKLTASDGKKRLTDCLDLAGIIDLAKEFPSNKAMAFLDWFIYSDNTLDGQSKKKAYTFWESNLIGKTEIGSIQALQKIHAYIFGGLYNFAGKIRTRNISKGGFTFAPYQHFGITLKTIENMPETTFDEIADKYIEMNFAHPFMEGNGRATRIWLDLIFKRSLKKVVDWSKINKNDYLTAMINSCADSVPIKKLLKGALTNKIHSREIFMKGIDYSYYYEEHN